MTKYFLVLLLFCFAYIPLVSAQTPGSFSTTWDTTNPGTSTSTQITIPTTGGGYDYDIYWEDTSSSTINGTLTNNLGNVTIDFPAPGIYRVDITGDFPRIFFNNTGDRQKILTVEQWGSNPWTSMSGAFFGAVNLRINALDAPDLSAVIALDNMFNGAVVMNDNINHWDVSNAQTIRRIFYGTLAFNQPLDNWNVGNVRDFRDTFYNSAFNQNIDNWDTGSGTNFAGMFMINSVFNQPINNWNMASATNLGSMFRIGSNFNQPLDNWNVSNVTNTNNFMLGSSAYSAENYSDLLVGWAALPSLNSGLTLNIQANYFNYASSSRLILTDTYGWSLGDLGPIVQYAVTYNSVGGSIVGSTTQIVTEGQDAETVEFVPDEGFQFVQWSDGVLDNPRTDTAVSADIAVSAVVEEVQKQSSGSSATNPSIRKSKKNPDSLVSTTTDSKFSQSEIELAAAILIAADPELFADHDFSQPITDPDKKLVVLKELLRLMMELLQVTQGVFSSDAYWEMS